MAYPPRTRSSVDELNLGMVEGSYKLIAKDRGGFIDPATYAARRDLADVWHGIHEAPVKEAPDGLPVVTPTFVPTPPARPEAV